MKAHKKLGKPGDLEHEDVLGREREERKKRRKKRDKGGVKGREGRKVSINHVVPIGRCLEYR